MTSYDAVIVGAGIAGTAMAITLGRQGRRVLLIERDLREPDRIVGELLQPGGVAALQRLGLIKCLDDIDALPLRGYSLIYDEEEITFMYPHLANYPVWAPENGAGDKKSLTSADKRHEGRSLRNGRLVNSLRKLAYKEENVKVIEATAKQFLWSEDGKTVVGVKSQAKSETDEEAPVEHYLAPLTVVSDGQASSFRQTLTGSKPQARSRFYGLKLIDTDLDYNGLSLGIFGKGWPAGIYQIGPNETRILIDVPVTKEKPQEDEIKDHIRTHVRPVLPAHMHAAVDKSLKEDKMRSMANAWLPPCQTRTPGVLLLGDAYNIRHPISGSGMTVALHDVVVLSELLNPARVPSLGDYALVRKQVAEFRKRRVSHSLVLNFLAQMMYLLVIGKEDHWRMFQAGFVSYARVNNEDLSAIIGGVLLSPRRLFNHLSAVAVLSIKMHVGAQYARSVWRVPGAVLQCVVACVRIMFVSFPYVVMEMLPV